MQDRNSVQFCVIDARLCKFFSLVKRLGSSNGLPGCFFFARVEIMTLFVMKVSEIPELTIQS